MDQLLYTPKLPKGFEQEDFDVNEWMRLSEENRARIKELDQKAKEQGSILYRFLYEHVIDEFGIYQIIKVNKKTCRVRFCTTDGFSEYQVPQWGETATIPLEYALRSLSWRE